uniref:Uncharacterized protein n=1 Tax=Opuntia streptacantha TaxID=393608 RepID=A0A7C9A0P9_OPUST
MDGGKELMPVPDKSRSLRDDIQPKNDGGISDNFSFFCKNKVESTEHTGIGLCGNSASSEFTKESTFALLHNSTGGNSSRSPLSFTHKAKLFASATLRAAFLNMMGILTCFELLPLSNRYPSMKVSKLL